MFKLFKYITYIPKKAKMNKDDNIYNEIIAHRGYHLSYPENSILAYEEAIKRNDAIELDIRMTKDGIIICIHDRYLRKLLGIKGRASKLTYEEIKNATILKSKSKVPTFDEALDIINGKVTLLIEVKGLMNERFERKIISRISNYNGRVFFHAKNVFTYNRLKRTYNDKVFWILNPFRRRFNFIKAKRKYIN